MNCDNKLHVGVLGTGLPALFAAQLIEKAGHSATVLDSDCGYVRLGRTFPYGGGRFDQFVQTVSVDDAEVYTLVKALGVEPVLQPHKTPRAGLSWLWSKNPKTATAVGLSQALELALRDRLQVEQVVQVVDLMEFDYSIELRTREGRRQFDAIVTTVPLEELDEMARGLIAQDLPRSQARHRTLVSVVFISTVPLLKKYATFVENSSLPFTCVSSVTNPESGLTAINVSGCSEAPEMELKILATRFLSEKFGEFQPSCVEAVRVFQSSERIPVYPLNEKVEPIPARVGEGRLFLASRELGYGRPVSMNTDLFLARKAVEAFLECAPTFVCGARPAALAAAR